MILQVPFEQFAATVQRALKTKEAYVTPKGPGALVTAADPSTDMLVVSLNNRPVAETTSALKAQNFEVFEGCWHTEETIQDEASVATPYVAAVSYVSQEHMPGVWVDAFASAPTQMAVLKALFEEFKETGQVLDVTFEEFVRLAQPNVAIVSPSELHGYVAAKEC
jgi:hypothetical protein